MFSVFLFLPLFSVFLFLPSFSVFLFLPSFSVFLFLRLSGGGPFLLRFVIRILKIEYRRFTAI